MRWTSRSWLWGLLAVLLFGLVLMHHTPSHGGHDSESAATAAVGSGVVMAESGVVDCPCPAVDHQAPLPGGGGETLPGGGGETDVTALLHLCLAVLAALGGMVSAGFVLRWTISPVRAGALSFGRRIGSEYLRSSVPVPRRLAALCVLRL